MSYQLRHSPLLLSLTTAHDYIDTAVAKLAVLPGFRAARRNFG